MTYRELICDIVKKCDDLDSEVYVVEWTRDEHGVVDPHKTHAPIARFSFLDSELVIEQSAKRHKP